MKKALSLYLFLFSKSQFSIRKNGTNEISRINPEHHPVHAREDSDPPATERPTRIYFFISVFQLFSGIDQAY